MAVYDVVHNDEEERCLALCVAGDGSDQFKIAAVGDPGLVRMEFVVVEEKNHDGKIADKDDNVVHGRQEVERLPKGETDQGEDRTGGIGSDEHHAHAYNRPETKDLKVLRKKA